MKLPSGGSLEGSELCLAAAKRPHLRDWYKRVKARESYQEALTKWENPAYFEVYRTQAPTEWPQVEAILK